MRKNLILITIFLSVSILSASEVIMGYVINSASQEPLSDVNVIVLNQEVGSSTDSYGYFQIQLPQEFSEVFIEASAVGF